jgi:formate hydrogenlyase subunit 3/multisubunit Na+/H+ antiporter MnhD subunit
MAASIVVPLAGATAALVFGSRGGRWLGLVTALAAAAAHGAVALAVLGEGALRHRVGGWGAPLGIDLRADGLSALMLVMLALVGVGITVHAGVYLREEGDEADETPAADHGRLRRLLFWPLWLFLWAALAALFLTRDVFNVYVTLELAGLSSVALIALAGDRAAIGAATRYLVLAILGSLAYLLAIGLLYAAFGTLDADRLRAALVPGVTVTAAAALVGGGLAVKAALFPLHGWLPPAHGGAPAPVSAALSALVVKASFYLLVRWFGEILPVAVAARADLWLGLAGSAAILWGSLQALRQERLKLVIAYSTVAQLGYLFLYFPLARGMGARAALLGAGLFALAHALAKASLFLSAGAVLHALPSDRVEGLRGLGSRLPLTAASLALASVSIVALPPSGGFAAKWLLLEAAIRAGAWHWVVVMLGGGLLAAGYSFRILERVIGPGPAEQGGGAPQAMQWAALGLAVGALAVGLAPWAPIGLLQAAPLLGGGAP